MDSKTYVTLIGDDQVGQSSLKFCFSYGHSVHQCDRSVSEPWPESKKFDDGVLNFFITDFPKPLEEFEAYMLRSALSNSSGIIIVYSVDNRESYENVHMWLDKVHEARSSPVPMAICANKCDIDESLWKVSHDENHALAEKLGIPVFETSAELNTPSIKDAFSTVLDQIWEKQKPQQSQKKGNCVVC